MLLHIEKKKSKLEVNPNEYFHPKHEVPKDFNAWLRMNPSHQSKSILKHNNSTWKFKARDQSVREGPKNV